MKFIEIKVENMTEYFLCWMPFHSSNNDAYVWRIISWELVLKSDIHLKLDRLSLLHKEFFSWPFLGRQMMINSVCRVLWLIHTRTDGQVKTLRFQNSFKFINSSILHCTATQFPSLIIYCESREKPVYGRLHLSQKGERACLKTAYRRL